MWEKTGRTYTGRSEKVFYLSNGGHFDHHLLCYYLNILVTVSAFIKLS